MSFSETFKRNLRKSFLSKAPSKRLLQSRITSPGSSLENPEETVRVEVDSNITSSDLVELGLVKADQQIRRPAEVIADIDYLLTVPNSGFKPGDPNYKFWEDPLYIQSEKIKVAEQSDTPVSTRLRRQSAAKANQIIHGYFQSARPSLLSRSNQLQTHSPSSLYLIREERNPEAEETLLEAITAQDHLPSTTEISLEDRANPEDNMENSEDHREERIDSESREELGNHGHNNEEEDTEMTSVGDTRFQTLPVAGQSTPVDANADEISLGMPILTTPTADFQRQVRFLQAQEAQGAGDSNLMVSTTSTAPASADNLGVAINQIHEILSGTQSAINTITNVIQEMGSKLQIVSSAQNSIVAKITNLEGMYQTLGARMSSIEANQKSLVHLLTQNRSTLSSSQTTPVPVGALAAPTSGTSVPQTTVPIVHSEPIFPPGASQPKKKRKFDTNTLNQLHDWFKKTVESKVTLTYITFNVLVEVLETFETGPDAFAYYAPAIVDAEDKQRAAPAFTRLFTGGVTTQDFRLLDKIIAARTQLRNPALGIYDPSTSAQPRYETMGTLAPQPTVITTPGVGISQYPIPLSIPQSVFAPGTQSVASIGTFGGAPTTGSTTLANFLGGHRFGLPALGQQAPPTQHFQQ